MLTIAVRQRWRWQQRRQSFWGFDRRRGLRITGMLGAAASLRLSWDEIKSLLIGDMQPIEVAGVDVIDSEPNDLAQDCDRAVVIFWWPEYMRTSELHGAVAHASQDQIIGKLDCAAGQGGGGHRF